jgi:hypothetical protein
MSDGPAPVPARSARGLFRALGKAPLPEPQLIDGVPQLVAGRPREAADFYPTPPEPTEALTAAEARALARFPAIWEPAAGDGAMVRVLERAGFCVVPSDLHDRGQGYFQTDFLALDRPMAPCVVTNPPFNLCNARDGQGRWISHGMGTLGLEYMALLLPWSWPGPAGLARLWRDHPPARVYLMRWKIDFTGQGAPPSYHGWFVWDRAWAGETVLRMLDRPAQPQLFGRAA